MRKFLSEREQWCVHLDGLTTTADRKRRQQCAKLRRHSWRLHKFVQHLLHSLGAAWILRDVLKKCGRIGYLLALSIEAKCTSESRIALSYLAGRDTLEWRHRWAFNARCCTTHIEFFAMTTCTPTS